MIVGGKRSASTPTVGNWSDAGKKLEREADEFAAELLIPTSYARPRFSESVPSLQIIGAMARDCRASLTATAWRYCDLVPYPCAIVWSTDGRIAWWGWSLAAPVPACFLIEEVLSCNSCSMIRVKTINSGTASHCGLLAQHR